MGMITRYTRTARRAAALAILFLATAPAAAIAQDSKDEPKPKEPPDSAKLAEWKTEAEALPLFTAEEPLTLTLKANFRVVNRDRDTLSTKEYWGELSMKGPDSMLTWPVKLRTRGHYRLSSRNCGFVPLRLDFAKKDVAGSPFEGQDKIKLTTHCNSSSEFEQYVLREYLVYKVQNLITPRSHRARLARITYVDSASGKELETRNAMFTEHEDHVAHRMGGEVAELRGALFADVDQQQLNEVALFEYFAGGVDWSLAALHNIRLVRQLNGTILPIAYDWDFTGLVGTRYAIPDPRLNIRSVKDRLYRGPCRTPEEMEPYLAVYREKEAAILALYDNLPGLDARYANDVKRWLGDFFRMIKSPRDVKFTFQDGCRKVPGV